MQDLTPLVHANPTVFWDIFGKQGHPIRTTISDLGPLLISHMLELNDTQTGIVYSSFKIADDQGLLLLDLKDFRSMLNWVGGHAKELKNEYGNISSASIGAGGTRCQSVFWRPRGQSC